MAIEVSGLINFDRPDGPSKKQMMRKVNRFIKLFNKKIKKGEFKLNTSLDKGVEELNDAEFELARLQAFVDEYVLIGERTNESITYTLKSK